MLQIKHFLKLLKINAMKDNKKVKNTNNREIKNNVNEKDEPDVLLLKYQFLALF